MTPTYSRPWSLRKLVQRLLHAPRAATRTLRGRLRDGHFQLFEKTLTHGTGRALLARSIRGWVQEDPWTGLGASPLPARPYESLPPPAGPHGAAARDDVIFVTGRFRSGSTFLWNLFRSVPEVTSYYEPLNERRWFDPAARGDRVDPTHRHVEEYWREYEGLEELGQHYRVDWIDTNLYMDARFPDPDLRSFIDLLIERSKGRPVLQFNRVDFRLPWLRRTYPRAAIVHIYRHPRDQWCSCLQGDPCPLDDLQLEAFEPWDRFYLRSWVRDLAHAFPVLRDPRIRHPYEAFYLVWRLAHAFGARYATHSVRFEDIAADPVGVAGGLLEQLGIRRHTPERILEVFSPPHLGKWRAYAREEWFRRREQRCEDLLAEACAPVDESPAVLDRPLGEPRTAAALIAP
jgi:hypothetical protein